VNWTGSRPASKAVRALRRVGFETSTFRWPRLVKERSEHRRSLPFDSAERSRSDHSYSSWHWLRGRLLHVIFDRRLADDD